MYTNLLKCIEDLYTNKTRKHGLRTLTIKKSLSQLSNLVQKKNKIFKAEPCLHSIPSVKNKLHEVRILI